MARPAKSVETMSKNLTKEEKEARITTENRLKGSDDNLVPASYLNARQKEIFNYIIDNLKQSKILGNLDIFTLNQASIVIERLEYLEKQANEDIEVLLKSTFKAAKDMYSKEFFRYCNELCLSPQARAKLSIAAIKEPEKKTLKDILAEDDE